MSANTQDFRVKFGLNVTQDAVVGANLTVANAASFGNSVTIAGDLVVTGNTTFNNTTTLELGTGEILLVANASGAPTTNATVTVNRGSGANVQIRWNESTDRWEYTNDGSIYFPFRTYVDITHQFSTLNSTNVDPGSGKIRFNNGTPSSVTQIAIDINDYGGQDITSFIDSIDDSNSTTPAYLFFRSSNDPTKLIVFTLTSITSQTGYRQLNVAHVSGSSLFANDDLIFFSINRVGDKGQKGEKGNKGDKGERVNTATYTDGNNTVTFTNSDTSTFTITGVKGQKGERVNSAVYSDGNNTVTFTNSDSSTFTVNGVKGEKGQKGERVNSATYSDGNNTVTFTNSDSSTFTVTGVKGQKGDKGEKGQKGDTGEKGQKGERVNSATYNDGLNQITFTNSDSSTFTVSGVKGQKGQKGDTGSPGTNGAPGEKGQKGEVGITIGVNANCNSLAVGTSAFSTAGAIRATNEITAYYSDDRLKTKLGSIKDALGMIRQLDGFYYEPNEVAQSLGYEKKKHVGLSAQDTQKVLPEAIDTAPIDSKYLTIKYEKLIPVLVQAIKELEELIKNK